MNPKSNTREVLNMLCWKFGAPEKLQFGGYKEQVCK